jgi:hypothetical protein
MVRLSLSIGFMCVSALKCAVSHLVINKINKLEFSVIERHMSQMWRNYLEARNVFVC